MPDNTSLIQKPKAEHFIPDEVLGSLELLCSKPRKRPRSELHVRVEKALSLFQLKYWLITRDSGAIAYSNAGALFLALWMAKRQNIFDIMPEGHMEPMVISSSDRVIAELMNTSRLLFDRYFDYETEMLYKLAQIKSLEDLKTQITEDDKNISSLNALTHLTIQLHVFHQNIRNSAKNALKLYPLIARELYQATKVKHFKALAGIRQPLFYVAAHYAPFILSVGVKPHRFYHNIQSQVADPAVFKNFSACLQTTLDALDLDGAAELKRRTKVEPRALDGVTPLAQSIVVRAMDLSRPRRSAGETKIAHRQWPTVGSRIPDPGQK